MHMSYNERLHYLGLSSLELRRLHLDLTYCYKIVFGVVDFRCIASCYHMFAEIKLYVTRYG